MKSETFWNFLAKNYDGSDGELGENDRRIVEKTTAHLKETDTLLDYGCASGGIALELALKVKQVTGVDISSKMLEIAERRSAERGSTNIDFIHGDIFDEKLAEGSFDIITAFAILHLVEDRPKVVRQIEYLLKPGGLFISLTPCMGEKNLKSSLFRSGIYILSRIGIMPRNIGFFDRDTLLETMEDTGFEIVETDLFATSPVADYFIVARKREKNST